MMPFRGQASRAKMASPRGKLTALACHTTKRINKAEELTYLSTNIGWYPTLSNWEFVKSNFLTGFASLGVLNKDPTFWVDGARPPPLVIFVLPLPENEFNTVMI